MNPEKKNSEKASNKYDIFAIGNDRYCKNRFTFVNTVEYSSVRFLKWKDGT